MTKRNLIVATLLFSLAGTAFAFQPRYYRKGNTQTQGPKGRQTGPQDGTGPIHTPGTGGGAGTGQGKGKMSGPRDGSGPIHTPGTGGGTGAGNRRGRN